MLLSNIQFTYLKNGTWNTFSNAVESTIDGIQIQTPSNNSFYLKYRTWNEGKSTWYSKVDSNTSDYAGAPNRPVQRLQIQVYKNDGTKLTEKIVVMYRARVSGRWLPWVSNAEPEWMQSVHSKYNLGGTIDTESYFAGNAGQNIDGLKIRVYEEAMLGDFTGGEISASMQYMVGSLDNWQSFDNGVYAEQIDGIKIQTGTEKGYYLQYRSKNEGKSNWCSYVKSTGTAYNDYAGLPGKPIQLLEINAYKNDGTKLSSGVIVMYRVSVAGRWLPWVSNTDAQWMQNMQNKYSLDGTLSPNSTYAGNAGQNIDGIEIHVYEDASGNAGLGNFSGIEEIISCAYMANNGEWNAFEKSATASEIDGITIGTDLDDSYYFMYKSWNEGNNAFYPEVSSLNSLENNYTGHAGKPIQLLSIQAYNQDGTRLRSGVVVMYRVRIAGRWLPWVSNADPEWMRSVQKQFGLDGTLDTKSTYAGNKGQNIDGVEIRVFRGETDYHPVGSLPGSESNATFEYMTDSLSNWNVFSNIVTNDHIDGIKIRTDSSKPYYISYRSWNSGKSNYYPYVDSRGTAYNDYAGYPGKPIQLLNIYVYRKNDGVKIKSGVVVMYRVRIAGRWLPWVSNADPEWMRSVQEKYDLGGTLDTKSTYAGNKGQNIDGVEIHIYEESNTDGGTITPVGNYKIIQNVPFISQLPKYPTGCESVSTVMALNYAGVNIAVDDFIDKYLEKGNRNSFDPNICFGGNPYSKSGYGCYSPVIKKALDNILYDSLLYAKEVQGKSISYLCSEYIDRDIPVIFWATQHMEKPRNGTKIPYNNKYIQWISPMHCLLLVGYDDTHYIFHDPQEHAKTFYSKESVEAAYKGLFMQAIVISNRIKELDRLDRQQLTKTYYFTKQIGESNLHSSDFNDYNALACLQLLYTYYFDKQDYEKTDFLYDEMINIRKLNPSYKTIYTDFIDSSGEFDLGYKYYAKGRKTTKINYTRTIYFSKDRIREMHQADDWMVFMTSLIPKYGTYLSLILDASIKESQNETVELSSLIISGGFSAVSDFSKSLIENKWKASKYVFSAISTLWGFSKTAYDTSGENRETYVRDGITVQDGDSYVDVSLHYDLGVERHDFSFYFRNGNPYVTSLPQYTVRWDTDSQSKAVAKKKVATYSADGYVPSEKHAPRGQYWPLNE